MKILLRVLVALLICSSAALAKDQAVSCESPSAVSPEAKYEYFVSFSNHATHSLSVVLRMHTVDPMLLQMPAWNALYQVRDFAQYVTDLQARDATGVLPVRAEGKSAWRVEKGEGCVLVSYKLYASVPGPFSAEVNADHAFLNWAQVLVYADRSAPLMISLRDVPQGWAVHDTGLFDEAAQQLKNPVSYDKLVDDPVELSSAKIETFEDGGARYRIVVDGDPADYRMAPLKDAIERVVHAETEWMGEHPFAQYTFLFHFPRGPIGGGMEHAYGTAISAPASRVRDNPLAPVGTAAHEFFHLWNVKRIRPQSMEPVDYEHEQYSPALWFCEGVTSTVSEWMMVRAGLNEERGYLAHLSGIISDFQSRPAHATQSPEASSVEAWMEGRPYYRRPERSVSYYTSGEIVGVLLDLEIRKRTQGSKSLRDLFHHLNDQYAKQGRFYDDNRDLQRAAETVAGGSFEDFFRDYVTGTKPLPYDDAFRLIGLKLAPMTLLVPDAGFDASVNFTGLPEVMRVDGGSAVEAAGVHVGDTLAAIDDREYTGDLSSYLGGKKPGETASFRFLSRRGQSITVRVTLKQLEQPAFAVVDLPNVSAEQRTQRAAWIRGDDLAPGARR